MTEVLVLGDGVEPSARSSHHSSVLPLTSIGPNANVRLQIDAFRTKFFCEIPERLDDLLHIAAFVFSADSRIPRGSIKDVFAEKWSRHFSMLLPVKDLNFWNQKDVGRALTDVLNFLTGDEFSFEFVQRLPGEPHQGNLFFKDSTDSSNGGDVVIPFSGGSDSLAATLMAVRNGRHPVLVSHRAAPKIDRRQKDLVDQLKTLFAGWRFPHLSMWVNRIKGERPTDFSQRSRSFLFTSMSVVAAAMLNIDEVWLCDNGIVSINLPQSGQNVGTFLSRSTHPRYIALVQDLMQYVTGRSGLCISNQLLFQTRREVLARIMHEEVEKC